MKSPRRGGAQLLLFGLAFAVRSIPAARVFDIETGALHLIGGDPLYHLRRVLFSLENFPRVLRFDPYMNFPFGGEPIWPPLFDGLLTLVALPVYRDASPEGARSVETLLVWVPPAIGALAVVGLYHLGRRVFDESVALCAALVLALLPAHYWYSQAGFVDHHAAVALGFVLLLLTATRLLERLPGDSSNAAAAGLGAAFAGMLLLWPGCLLHVLVVEGFVLARAIAADRREDAVRHARAIALANGVAALIVAPFGLSSEWKLWSPFSPAVLSCFQPWLFAALTVCALGCASAWQRGFGEKAADRSWVAAGIGIGILGLSLSLFPELVRGAADAAGWLFKDEVFQATVAESRPLFVAAGVFDRTAAEGRLTRFVYLSPLAAGWAWAQFRRHPNAAAVQLVVLQFFAFGAVTLLQRRFFNSWSVVYALVLGFAAVAAWRLVGRRFEGGARVAALSLLLCFGLWLAAPVRDSYGRPLRNLVEALQGHTLTLAESTVTARRLDRAAVWLREETPPTAGFLDATARPAYGVLARWPHGHRIEMLGRRPSISNNFGDDIGLQNFLASHRFFQAEEQEAQQLSRDLRARYVLLRTTPAPMRRKLEPRSMQSRLSAPRAELEALDWLSLVYDEPADERGAPDDYGARIRIFELRPADAP